LKDFGSLFGLMRNLGLINNS